MTESENRKTAHELNNLLAVISGYSDLMMRKLGDQDASLRDLEEIKKASQRASQLASLFPD